MEFLSADYVFIALVCSLPGAATGGLGNSLNTSWRRDTQKNLKDICFVFFQKDMLYYVVI